MIGQHRIGTSPLGGGVRIDTIRARPRTAYAHAQVHQATIRTTHPNTGTTSFYSPSAERRVWNGKVWVNDLTPKWGKRRVWNGSEWVE